MFLVQSYLDLSNVNTYVVKSLLDLFSELKYSSYFYSFLKERTKRVQRTLTTLKAKYLALIVLESYSSAQNQELYYTILYFAWQFVFVIFVCYICISSTYHCKIKT